MKELKPHQLEAVEKLRNGSVLDGGVGVGKTLTALGYFVLKACGGSLKRHIPMTKPMKLVVITTAKKRNDRDWESEALHFGIFTEPELSYGGKGMVVDSWNNMHKYVDEKDAFFIFDEQRLVGKGAWVKAFLTIAKNNQWILLSATPADNWIDYVPLFLAHGFFRNRTHFMEEHVIWKMVNGRYPQIRGYYGVHHLKRLRDSILVEMPFDRHTVRHVVETEVDYDKTIFEKVWKKLWNVYDECPLLDSGEKHRVARKVVNSDPSRLQKIIELQSRHPRLIVFYSFDYELHILRTLGDELGCEVAEWNGHKHQPLPEGDAWIYLVQYQAGAEGWNCVTTDAMVFYSLTYSHKIFEQCLGRIDRMNTPYVDLYYYVLKTRAQIDKIIWASVRNKKSFHEGRRIKYGASSEKTRF